MPQDPRSRSPRRRSQGRSQNPSTGPRFSGEGERPAPHAGDASDDEFDVYGGVDPSAPASAVVPAPHRTDQPPAPQDYYLSAPYAATYVEARNFDEFPHDRAVLGPHDEPAPYIADIPSAPGGIGQPMYPPLAPPPPWPSYRPKVFLDHISFYKTPVTATLLADLYRSYLVLNPSVNTGLRRHLPKRMRNALAQPHLTYYTMQWLIYSRAGTHPSHWRYSIAQFIAGAMLLTGLGTAIGGAFAGGAGAGIGAITGAVIAAIISGIPFVGDPLADWGHTAYQNIIAGKFNHKRVTDSLESFERLGRFDYAFKYLTATSYSMISRYSFWSSMIIRNKKKVFLPTKNDIEKLFALAYAHKKATEHDFLKLYQTHFLKLYKKVNERLAKHQRSLFTKYQASVFATGGTIGQAPYKSFVDAIAHFVRKEKLATADFAPHIALDFMREFIGEPDAPAPVVSAASVHQAPEPPRTDNPPGGAQGDRNALTAIVEAPQASRPQEPLNPERAAIAAAEAALRAAQDMLAIIDCTSQRAGQPQQGQQPEQGQQPQEGQRPEQRQQSQQRQQAVSQQAQASAQAQQPLARAHPQRPQAPYTAPPQNPVAGNGVRILPSGYLGLDPTSARAVGPTVGLPLYAALAGVAGGGVLGGAKPAADVRPVAPSNPISASVGPPRRRPAAATGAAANPASEPLPPQPSQGPLLSGPSAQLGGDLNPNYYDGRVRADMRRVLPTREPRLEEAADDIEHIYRAFSSINRRLLRGGERPATVITLLRGFGAHFLNDAEALDINRRLGAGNQMLLFFQLDATLRPTPIMFFTRAVLAVNSIFTKFRDWALDHELEKHIKDFDKYFSLCAEIQQVAPAVSVPAASAASAGAPAAGAASAGAPAAGAASASAASASAASAGAPAAGAASVGDADAAAAARSIVISDAVADAAATALSARSPLLPGKLSLMIRLPSRGQYVTFQRLPEGGHVQNMLISKFINSNYYPKIFQIMYRGLLDDMNGLCDRLLLQEAAFPFPTHYESAETMAAAYLDNCLSLFKIVGRLYYVRAFLEFYAQAAEHARQTILRELPKVAEQYARRHESAHARPQGDSNHVDIQLNELRTFMVHMGVNIDKERFSP